MPAGNGQATPTSAVQVIGLCRFSYLGVGGFKVMHDRSVEERRRMLYDPSRLDARMIWFQHVFLPALMRQTDPDLTMVVLTGEDLPLRWLDQLRALTSAHSAFKLALRPPMDHREACADVVRDVIRPEVEAVAQFRLDDDDSVALDYVQRIREDFGILRPLFLASKGMAVDYTGGIVLEDTGAGVRAERRDQTFWGCGLTLYLPPVSSRQVLDFQHHKIWQHLPTVLRARPLMWVRGAHQTNDSRFRRPVSDLHADRDRMGRALFDRFRISLPELEEALAVYHANLRSG